jgi:acyl-CoA thioesterase I
MSLKISTVTEESLMMGIAKRDTYTREVVAIMQEHWPQNRTVNIVCHGHSVPGGYFATPLVNTFEAYPHLLHRGLKERFPYAVINVIVTAVGGENSSSGQKRFVEEVMCHKPDVVTIDYGLNDRSLEISEMTDNYRRMVKEALAQDVKVLLFTPSWDFQHYNSPSEQASSLKMIAEQIRLIAVELGTGLVDSFDVFEKFCRTGDLSSLMSWTNHPNRAGHQLIAEEAIKWFGYI